MSELDDLPSWAGRSTEEVQLPTDPPDEAPSADDSVPEPPALPGDGEPEISAQTAAAQAPPASSPASTPAPSVASEPAASAASPLRETGASTRATLARQTVEVTPRRSRLRLVLFGLLGLAILAGAAAVGYVLSSRDSDATEPTGAAAADEAEETDSGADGDTDGSDAGRATAAADGATDGDGTVAADGDESMTEDGDGSDAEADTEDGGTVTVQVDGEDDAAEATTGDDGDAPLNDGDRQAIFRGGVVYLSGAVPSEEIGEAIVAKAEDVVGPGNVVNEYEIDPSVTIEPGSSAPLYVEDVILFEFNSIEIAAPFLPILDLGTLLLRQNPQASVTVVTRTDAVGSEEINLEVAGRRAQAVINYWISQGVDPDQIIADPRGEEGTSDDDDAETAARQRRAEFIITGLLD